jgi:hypothetical protein
MATMPKPEALPVDTPANTIAVVPKPEEAPTHDYHMDAQLLEAEFKRPLTRKIEPQARLSLENDQDGYSFQQVGQYNANGLISFESGYTRVSGSKSEVHGWVALATVVIEGLNILDVITADRIVAQISTEHPLKPGYVPRVTFLGTRFENLRIVDQVVEPDMVLKICGPKPTHDRLYLEDSDFRERVRKQSEDISSRGLPAELVEKYHTKITELDEIGSFRGTYGKGYAATLKCSLVQSVTVQKKKSLGNILHVPDFGYVTLGAIEVQQKLREDSDKTEQKPPVSTYFDLTMLDITMGSIAQGSIQVANAGINGITKP